MRDIQYLGNWMESWIESKHSECRVKLYTHTCTLTHIHTVFTASKPQGFCSKTRDLTRHVFSSVFSKAAHLRCQPNFTGFPWPAPCLCRTLVLIYELTESQLWGPISPSASNPKHPSQRVDMTSSHTLSNKNLSPCCVHNPLQRHPKQRPLSMVDTSLDFWLQVMSPQVCMTGLT